MKKKKKILIIVVAVLLVAAVAAVLLFRMKGKDKDPVEEPDPVVPAPIMYEVKDFASVVAIPVGESIIVTEEKPKKVEEEKKPSDQDDKDQKDKEDTEADQDGEEKVSKKSKKDKKKDQDQKPAEEQETEQSSADAEPAEEAGPDITVSVTYHYAGLPTPEKRIRGYCELLTAEDFGFIPIDEKIMATKLPDLEAPEGNVNLVHPVGEEGEESLFSLQIAWQADGTFSVTVAQIAGGIVVPPAPQPITLEEAEDFFYNSDPAVFGLSGDSMEDYEIYALDGAVLVGTVPCLRMNVYEKDEVTGTNKIAGQYLLSNTGLQLYWVGNDGEIKEIQR